jgi:hypothetical protein
MSSSMLPVTDVVPCLVDSDTGLEPSMDEMDMNLMSHLLQRVPDSEQGVYPDSDDDDVNVDLLNGDDCVKIIADSENFTWNRRKQGDFAFMEQDFEDEAPAVPDDEVTKELTLDWVEGGCLPELTDKMKDTSGGLRKGREKNFRSPVISFMSTLLIVFWKVSFGESNRFAHQEMAKAKAGGKTESNICGSKWKDITLGEFMVFFGILLQMCLFPLPGHSYVLYWAYGAIMFPFMNKMQLRRFQQIRSVLHFNDNETIPLNDDALHKVRPLVNIVKVIFGTWKQQT